MGYNFEFIPNLLSAGLDVDMDTDMSYRAPLYQRGTDTLG
jgi:hypothetical protein